MLSLTPPELIARIAERSGLSWANAERLTRVTLGALGDQLRTPEVDALAEELPPTLAKSLTRPGARGPRGLSALLGRVAGAEPGSLSFVGEHAGVVCEVLAEALRPPVLRWLLLALPDDVAALLAPRERGAASLPARVNPEHHTLAEARAASRHPLFASAPPGSDTSAAEANTARGSG